MNQDLPRLFRFNRWANGELGAALAAAEERAPAEALARFAHLVAAERLWIGRLRGEAPSMAVWPDLPIEEGRAELERLHLEWIDFVTAAGFDPAHTTHYVNSKGEAWSSTVGDILTHVLFHAMYHRGQIAADLRRAGFAPPYTDFIFGTRESLFG